MTIAAGQSATPPPAGGPEPAPSLSITDFLTDGSLVSLCAEVSRLTGVEVQLRDAHGRRIVRPEEPGNAWAVVDEPLPDDPGARSFPLRVGGERIGSILVAGGTPEQTSIRVTRVVGYGPVLKALGATNGIIARMVITQAVVACSTGYALGVGFSATMGTFLHIDAMPYKLLWTTMALAGGAVLLVGVVAGTLSMQRLVRLEAGQVFKA